MVYRRRGCLLLDVFQVALIVSRKGVGGHLDHAAVACFEPGCLPVERDKRRLDGVFSRSAVRLAPSPLNCAKPNKQTQTIVSHQGGSLTHALRCVQPIASCVSFVGLIMLAPRMVSSTTGDRK